MSPNCKIVKGISLFMLLLGLVSAIFGIVVATGVIESPDASVGQLAVQVAGAVLIVVGVCYLVVGVMGALGANNPAKLKPYIIASALLAVVNVIEVILVIIGGTGVAWMNLVLAVLSITGIVYASRARKEARDKLL